MDIKILVVDDEKEICDFSCSFLNKKNYKAFSAQTKDEALAVARRERPHIVLLDVRLNMESGLDVLRELKSLDKEMKVVMVTAFDDDESKRQAISLGADDYVVKPLEAGVVINMILQKISSLKLDR